MEQTLHKIITSANPGAPFGATQDGADWAIKALHPSDPNTQIRGIPDASAASSLCLNYQTVATLSPRPAATGTWAFDATLLPHPVDLLTASFTDSVGSSTMNVLNSQIPGTTHPDKVAWLVANAQAWRLSYCGVTVIQDGPDLANQGTIVVAQVPLAPLRFPTIAPTNSVSIPSWNGHDSVVYTGEDEPDFNSSQAMPSAYLAASKLGAYVPLKLTRTCQQWMTQADLVCNGDPSGIGLPIASWRLNTTTRFCWPHWDLESPWTSGGILNAAPTSPMLNGVCAHICARNLAVTTSYTFYIRIGIEMRVHSSSSLSPQLELAPRMDDIALEVYFRIARELKDAYPASYNDLNKLWGVISGAAKKVLPLLGTLGPTGRLISTTGDAVVQVGDAISRSRRSRRRARSKPARK